MTAPASEAWVGGGVEKCLLASFSPHHPEAQGGSGMSVIVQRQCLGPIGQGGGSQARALAPASALPASA